MRKWLSSLSYISINFIAILLLLPLLFGLLAEKKCAQLAEIINTTTPFNAKIINYQRGWFSATATAQVSLEKLEISSSKLQPLVISAHIIHGPMFIDWTRFQFAQAIVNVDINFNAEQNRLSKRAVDAKPIASAKIKLRLSGDTIITLNSLPFAHQDQENDIYWEGIKTRSIFSPLGNQVKSDLDFSGIEIKRKDFDLHIGKITSSYQGSKTTVGLWVGKRDLFLDSFSTKNDNNHTIAFDGLDIHNIVTENQKNSTNITTDISINNININGGIYNHNKLNFEIDKLDQTLLTKIQQRLLSSKIISTPASLGLDILISILNNGSEIKIKEISTNTPWGKFLSSITITSANQNNNPGLLATIANSTINADIKAERVLALHLLEKFYQIIPSQTKSNNPEKQAEDLLNEWQQSGKIVTSDQDNYLHLIFDYKNNQPLINNKLLILTTQP
ncbi:MAG: YdgA family protein [Coxiellaceae bacterium]|jgi:hypothetical protein|nr:YdgA family protein [Coxiellaceae bacterium]